MKGLNIPMMIIFENRQRKVDADLLKVLKHICSSAVHSVVNSDYIDIALKERVDDLVISISFIGSVKMKKTNHSFRGINYTTDVLSFPMLNMSEGQLKQSLVPADIFIRADGKQEIMLGDILINLDRVFSQADELGHSLGKELFFLVVHSVLHLIGYDHISECDEKVMLEAQREIIKLFKE